MMVHLTPVAAHLLTLIGAEHWTSASLDVGHTRHLRSRACQTSPGADPGHRQVGTRTVPVVRIAASCFAAVG